MRTIEDIFPKHYPGTPDAAYLRRVVEAHIECAQLPEDLHLWVNREDCPYMREAFATAMMQAFADRAMDPERAMNGMIRTQVEDQLNHIIQHAQAEQCANERLHAEGLQEVAGTPDATMLQQQMARLQSQYDYLRQEVRSAIEELRNKVEERVPGRSFVWPQYAVGVADSEKVAFEDTIREICASRAKGLSARLKSYLNLKEKQGMILRPKSVREEVELLWQFGYPYQYNAYQNA